MIERLLAEIADTDAGDLEAIFVRLERAGRFAKGLAHAIAAVGPRGDVGTDAMIARIETDRVVR